MWDCFGEDARDLKAAPVGATSAVLPSERIVVGLRVGMHTLQHLLGGRLGVRRIDLSLMLLLTRWNFETSVRGRPRRSDRQQYRHSPETP